MSLDEARDYFEFLAHLGLTKHLGSMEATRELIDLCHIGPGQLVLDIGCGVGATPAYLARELGCQVVGVDLLESMIQQSQERARVEGVGGQIALAVADAGRLPFADGLFDAVIMESLNVFFDDRQAAMREYVRVTRAGGHVGITEMTWLKPPLPETAAYYRRVVYADALEAGGWMELLEDAGLEGVVGSARPVNIPRESRGRFERYGCRGIMRVLRRTLGVFLRDRASRAFLKDVTQSLPKDLLGEMGYGVYAGRKV
jgi:ubiquinone/menaquinone biosynthesis C-methylase UbiE